MDAKAAGTANGTAIQQYTCNGTTAQQYQLATTSGGYVRVNNRGNAGQVLDVTDVSTADNANIQTWAYGGGLNQRWQPVGEGGGVLPPGQPQQRQVLGRPRRRRGRRHPAGAVRLQR